MEFIEYPDREMMMIDLANRIAGELNTCLRQHDWASFAVPGGTTPGPIFDDLCSADLDWSRVHVMLTDERWVPEDHERSNTRLLRERLLIDRASAATYVPLYKPAETPEEVIDELSETIRPEMPISILLLGMGADMHTASLFPGADRLADALDRNAPPLMAMRAPGAPEPRITLTAPVLRSAMSTHVVITGAEKRAALEAARHMKPAEAPIATVLSDAMVHWAE
ncbi:6-phosphogluconolactonase [Alphaproteobacteria bacterium GH1-50]|uniref:6-phosphogluconolactonase n=1 Tax=Kangsaoukella pontilimi TaxID=2691042 RepID=A0A7C9MC86_9RHOB|nr:6-phosphogluconolactonase [Kangsaoukella pontilimi]MXQ06932.1 6-phosphogluconolactonase [Kangsaoukella pontilimi]